MKAREGFVQEVLPTLCVNASVLGIALYLSNDPVLKTLGELLVFGAPATLVGGFTIDRLNARRKCRRRNTIGR